MLEEERIYRILRTEQGTPVEEYFKHVPDGIKSACRVFETEEGAIIAHMADEK